MRTLALVPLLLGGLLAACTSPVQEQDAAAPGSLSVTQAWARATPPSASVGAAYFTIANGTADTDVLLSAASPLAARAELHRTVMADGMARMRPAGEIAIPAGASVRAEPGDLHLMLMDLHQPLVEGSMLPLELTFRTAGKVDVLVQIQPATATGAPDHAGH